MGWKLAEQCGRRMVKLMITDAHYWINKYQQIIDIQKAKLEKTLNQEHLSTLITAITLSSEKHREQRRRALKTKLAKIRKQQPDNTPIDCVVNLSKQPLSKTEQQLLQKGLNYNTGDASKTDFFAAFESLLKSSNLNEETQEEIRQTIVPMVKQKRQHTQLNAQELKALKKLKNRKDIVILPADKGRTTVVMDREEYTKKAEELLKDEDVYQQLPTNPIQTLDNRIQRTLNKLTKTGQITKQDRWRMKSNRLVLPRFYGRPKIHKANIPLRPIVSLPGTPTYNLSKELYRKLKHLTESCDHSINSAIQFLEKIRGIQIDEQEIMVSFEVTALYTSIGQKLAKETMEQLLSNDEQLPQQSKMQHTSWMECINLCLTTYF
uniref:Uncharacterized protein n=1 Tax=Trichobilharzia regenti TaxID=157069 RepID=A0AA85JCU6_TRIRE|nr:unnamed protein product [Trichobilharzia regenti]